MSLSRREKGPKRRSTGCIPCRARKKKCDGRKPSCMGCERNILLCRWTDAEAAVDPDARVSPFTCTTHIRRRYSAPNLDGLHATSVYIPTQKRNSLSIVREPSLGVSLIQHPISQMLYQHWLFETANNLSAVRGPGNGFAMELPKLALRYPDTVLQSLLALSGVHYCNKNGNPTVKELAWSHLAQALRALKYGLTRHVSGEEDQALPLLVTTLILCFVETTRGDVEGHLQHHLKASRPLLSSVLSSSNYRGDISTIEFIKEYYAYVSGITDLTVDFDQASEDPDFMEIGQLASPSNSGVLMGCSYELFDLVPQISRLSRLQNRKGNDGDRAYAAQLRKNLYFRILTWNPQTESDMDWIVCGRIYQQTLLVYLKTISGSQSDSEGDVEQHISTVIEFLAILPETSPIAVTLCWPLAMIGSRTSNLEHRHIVKTRLESMYTNFGIGNILTTVQFLDHLWEDQEERMEEDEAGGDGEGSRSRGQATSLDGMMQRYGLRMSFV